METPVIVAGDFNYPYGRAYFENLFKKYLLEEATKDIFYTYSGKFLRLFPVRFKNDYILYRNITNTATKRIDIYYSDHFPIVSEFELS